MKPPFTITTKIYNLSTEISTMLGKHEGLSLPTPKLELRKHNKIITIQASLAIEGNTLNIDQVTDIINNKKVIGPKNDILEVKNAIKTYEQLEYLNPSSLKSLLKAHNILMKGLIDTPGKLRSENVGVRGSEGLVHMAPKHTLVPNLIDNLFKFINNERELHPLIKSSIFHYEFEFIHPFIDGNGRIGRLWQSVMLYQFNNVFAYIPIETIIKLKQDQYYKAIQDSTKEGESTIFIEYMLEVIKEATHSFIKDIKPTKLTASNRIELAEHEFKGNLFSRKEYLKFHSNISPASATRDLIYGLNKEILIKEGDLRTTLYKFKKY
jgi:Fic family protein